jgi:glycerol-3-phosphate dehydrogenase
MLFEAGVPSEEKEDFISGRKTLRFRELSDEEKAAAIEKNPAYGRIICRCETITEGEIISALRRPIVPKTLDGIKRRCGAGMGRCQGGFCGPRVLEIISRELGIEPEKILLNREGSYILSGKTGKGGDNS